MRTSVFQVNRFHFYEPPIAHRDVVRVSTSTNPENDIGNSAGLLCRTLRLPRSKIMFWKEHGSWGNDFPTLWTLENRLRSSRTLIHSLKRLQFDSFVLLHNLNPEPQPVQNQGLLDTLRKLTKVLGKGFVTLGKLQHRTLGFPSFLAPPPFRKIDLERNVSHLESFSQASLVS